MLKYSMGVSIIIETVDQNEVLANFDIKFRYDKYVVLVAISIIIETIYLIIDIEVRYD